MCVVDPAQIMPNCCVPKGVSAASVLIENSVCVKPKVNKVLLEPKEEPGVVPMLPADVMPGSVVEKSEVTIGLSSDASVSVISTRVQPHSMPQQACPSSVAADACCLPQVINSMPADSMAAQGTSNTQCSDSLESSAAQQVSNDGTLTSAIQNGIPVTIDPSTLTGPVALNQVFVPIYSNTDKGPIIELVPIKTSLSTHLPVTSSHTEQGV